MKTCLLLLFIVVCGGRCLPQSSEAAQLVFDQPSVGVELPVDGQEAKAVLRFRNNSESMVRILEVRTECDCIQTSVSPNGIEAGKSGEITLQFRSKLRNGTDMVRAKVVADNGEIYEISVSAKLRSYIEVTPLALHWMKGEKREAKEFIVRSTGLEKLHFSKVAAVKDSKVEIQRGEDPTVIHVRVTPPAGESPFRDVLVISAVVEGTNETKLYDLQVSAD